MFCYSEGLLVAFLTLLVVTLALSRSILVSCLVSGSFYVVLRLFSQEPVTPERAQLVV